MTGTISSAVHGRGRRPAQGAVSRALVQVCTGDPVDLPRDPAAHDEFVEAARLHRVAPLAHVRLRDTETVVAEVLRIDRDTAKTTYLQSAMLLNGLGEILGDIPWVAFKGPILSEHAHPAPGLRSFNDVDILVSADTLREVSQRLRAVAWEVIDRDDMLRNPNTPGEMHWVSPVGMVVDLHWSMVNMANQRKQFTIPTVDLLADRVRVSVGLSSAWTLSPADSLVHVCLHAALTGAHRMLLLLDIDQMARRTDDWDAVVVQANRWGAAPAVSLALARAQTFLGTPMPADLDRRLGVSKSFRLVAAATNRLSPVPSLRQEGSLARLVARSVRPGGLQTIANIGRKAVQGLANRLGRQEDPVPWSGRAPSDADALDSYLRAVEDEQTATMSIQRSPQEIRICKRTQ